MAAFVKRVVHAMSFGPSVDHAEALESRELHLQRSRNESRVALKSANMRALFRTDSEMGHEPGSAPNSRTEESKSARFGDRTAAVLGRFRAGAFDRARPELRRSATTK